VAARWATFDCYGTLVDWRTGIGTELQRVCGGDREPLLERYHELEPALQADGTLAYREVMARALEAIAADRGSGVAASQREALASSLPRWPVYPDVWEELEELRRRGWRLAILSNTDRDLVEASIRAIGVPFDLAVVAGEIGSYKPALRHWEVFAEQSGADPARHVHVAQSLFHDHGPAAELSLPSVWINRESEPADPRPTRTLPGLRGLADTLDELVNP
jgi:2-haloacid dehalogenase